MNRALTLYRRVPDGVACVGSFVLALLLASVAGAAIGSGVAFAYDRGQTRGTDAFVFLATAHVAGAFAFIMLASLFIKLHHAITSQTPVIAAVVCAMGTLVNTCMFWDSYYSGRILFALLLTTMSALVACYVVIARVEREQEQRTASV